MRTRSEKASKVRTLNQATRPSVLRVLTGLVAASILVSCLDSQRVNACSDEVCGAALLECNRLPVLGIDARWCKHFPGAPDDLTQVIGRECGKSCRHVAGELGSAVGLVLWCMVGEISECAHFVDDGFGERDARLERLVAGCQAAIPEELKTEPRADSCLAGCHWGCHNECVALADGTFDTCLFCLHACTEEIVACQKRCPVLAQ